MVTGIVESVHEDGTVSVQTCCCVWPPIPGPSRWVAAAEELVVISSLSHVSGSRGRSFVRRPVVLTGWLSRDVHSPHQLGPPLVIFRAADFKWQTADLDLEMQLDELGHYILKALREWPTHVNQAEQVTGMILDTGIEHALRVVEDPEEFRNVVREAEELLIICLTIATRLQASRRGQWGRMRARKLQWERDAAIKVQKWMRVRKLQWERDAAIKVQKWMCARKLQWERDAAIKVQKLWRGNTARHAFKKALQNEASEQEDNTTPATVAEAETTKKSISVLSSSRAATFGDMPNGFPVDLMKGRFPTGFESAATNSEDTAALQKTNGPVTDPKEEVSVPFCPIQTCTGSLWLTSRTSPGA